jgi:hypothetical protein
MRRDDDRVRVEHMQRVDDRLHRVGVADRAGRGARLVLVRYPVAQAGVQRGRDDQDAGALRQDVAQDVALDGLVGDHEDLSHCRSFPVVSRERTTGASERPVRRL